jgi:uncharacterized Tic20 family protein
MFSILLGAIRIGSSIVNNQLTDENFRIFPIFYSIVSFGLVIRIIFGVIISVIKIVFGAIVIIISVIKIVFGVIVIIITFIEELTSRGLT